MFFSFIWNLVTVHWNYQEFILKLKCVIFWETCMRSIIVFAISLGYDTFEPVTVHQLFKIKHYLKLDSKHINWRTCYPKSFLLSCLHMLVLLMCIFVVKFCSVFLVMLGILLRCMSVLLLVNKEIWCQLLWPWYHLRFFAS